MRKYVFTVKGMGIEQGVICLTCVQTFLSQLAENQGVVTANYSTVKKSFFMTAEIEELKKASSVVSKTLKRTSYDLNKDFALDKISFFN